MYAIKYIELKSGYSDNGPAWIGKVKLSKSGLMIYFNDKGFKKCRGSSANYYDVETGEEYWISGIKKDEANRHWAGSGRIVIAKNVVDEYLLMVGKTKLNKQVFDVADIPEIYPIERINALENQKG